MFETFKNSDREILYTILKEVKQMALDFSALQAALAKLTADTNTLIGIAQNLLAGGAPNPADQATVNSIAASLSALDTSVVAGETLAAGPTGSTGTGAPTGTTGTSTGTTGATGS